MVQVVLVEPEVQEDPVDLADLVVAAQLVAAVAAAAVDQPTVEAITTDQTFIQTITPTVI